MRESVACSVDLQGLEPKVFDDVLQFIYTGSTQIASDTVESLLEAAVMLQIRCLQDKCESFLKKQIGMCLCSGRNGIWCK